MRILCTSAQKPDSTGSGVYLAETVRALLAAGHEVAVVAGIDAHDGPQLPAGTRFSPVRFNTPALPFDVCGMSDVMPYPATRYRDLTDEQTRRFEVAFAGAFAETLRTFSPDLVICHHLYLATAIMVDLAPSCPVWAVCHSTDLRQLKSHGLQRARIIGSIGRLSGVLALHEQQKAEICDLFGLPPARVRVLGTGYNAREFHRIEGLRPADHVRLLYAGKIWRAKGVESLLAALDALPADVPPAHLGCIGGYSDQAEYDRIRARAARCRVPVVFHGRVSQDDLVRGYNGAHVFVLPSFYEGLPLVVVEALACGCRVVVTDLPGIRPWLDAALPGAPVTYVEPPRMVGVDEPDPAALPAFERRLAAALADAIRAGAPEPFDTTPLSWDALAARMIALVSA